MLHPLVALGLGLVGALLDVHAQPAKTSLAGSWTLVQGIGGRGASIVAGREVTISQTASTLRIMRKRDAATISLTLDGKEHEVMVPSWSLKQPPVKLLYSAVWDGGSLGIKTTETIVSGRTGQPAQRHKRETLSLDGAVLIVRQETFDAWPPRAAPISERSVYKRVAK